MRWQVIAVPGNDSGDSARHSLRTPEWISASARTFYLGNPVKKFTRNLGTQTILGMAPTCQGLKGFVASGSSAIDWSAQCWTPGPPDRIAQSSSHTRYGAQSEAQLALAVLSSVMNNMRTVLASSLSIDVSSAQGAVREAMIYANVIASDLGPMIMPIASLGDTALAAFVGNHHRISQDSASRAHAATIAGKPGRSCSRRSLRKMWLR